MPAPVIITRTGTGWTVDVTSLQLSADLAFKDFFVTVAGVENVLANFTKTSSTVVTYTGVALPPSSIVQVLRDSTRLVTDFVFSEINSSVALNDRFTLVERAMEDIRVFYSVVGTLTASLNLTSTSTGVTAPTATNSTLVATTEYVKNNLVVYALTSALSVYATNAALANYATLSVLESYATNAALANYATLSVLASYATLSNPALSGTPTAPTAARSTSTTQIATTQFVQRRSRPSCILERITSNISLPTINTFTLLTFNNKIRDVDSAYNTANGQFTAPYAGYYEFKLYVRSDQSTGVLIGSITTSALAELVRVGEVGALLGTSNIISTSATVYLAASAVVVVAAFSTVVCNVVFNATSGVRNISGCVITYLGDDA